MEPKDFNALMSDMQILKDFILGFTSRDTDKEWQAFRRIRTGMEVLQNEKCGSCQEIGGLK